MKVVVLGVADTREPHFRAGQRPALAFNFCGETANARWREAAA